MISREASDWDDVVQVELRHGEHVGRGEAAPIARYDETAESALAFVEEHARCSATTPSRSRRSARASTSPGEQAAQGGARRGAARPRRASSLGVPVLAAARAAAASARRRPGRSGSATRTTWPVGPSAPPAAFRRLKLKLGGGDGLDVERVRAVRVGTELPLQVDVNECWSLDEALDALPQLAALGVEYCEQPLPRRRSRRRGAEAALAAPDLRRRGLPHARRRRRAAPRSRTGSTSSSRSPAASARRCGWRTPPARSASA